MPGRAAPGLLASLTGPKTCLLLGLLILAVACQATGDESAPLPATSTPSTSPTSAAAPISTGVPATGTPFPSPTLEPTWTAVPTPAPTIIPSVTPTPGCQGAGQVVTGRFASALAQPDLAYRIYLPPCYGQDDRVYPVLYMLPGNVHDDSIWDQLGLDEAADAGIQAGLLPPLLIVMPEGGAIASQSSGGPYSYEGVILNELRPFIESGYCAWPDPAGRAIGGLSRGGYWSLEIAFRNPTIFGAVGGHSPALVDTYAGPDLDPKFTALSADLSALRIYLDAGQSDWYLSQLRILHDNLLAVGKDHTWVIQEGGHVNDYWSAHVADYLAWYAESWPMDRAQLPRCRSKPAG